MAPKQPWWQSMTNTQAVATDNFYDFYGVQYSCLGQMLLRDRISPPVAVHPALFLNLDGVYEFAEEIWKKDLKWIAHDHRQSRLAETTGGGHHPVCLYKWKLVKPHFLIFWVIFKIV